MGVGVALNVECEGIGEDVLVVVGRAVEQSYSLALFDRRSPDLCIPARGALEGVDGARPADDFIRRRCGPDPLVQLPLFWMVEQSQHACRRWFSSGLVAGNQKREEKGAD